jgi:hypothetical protein
MWVLCDTGVVWVGFMFYDGCTFLCSVRVVVYVFSFRNLLGKFDRFYSSV